MEQKRVTVDTMLLMEQYKELLRTVKTLPLLVTGNSMAPFLVDRRDTVYLSGIRRPLRRGDIVLYQRRSGAYILHRICRREGDTFTMVGDAQTQLERGICREQIFAVVTAAERKGRWQEPGCFWWNFFANVWIHMVPIRPVLLRAYRFARKIFGRKP